MNLLDLAIKVGLDDQASDKIASIGSKVTSGLGSAAKAGAAALGAAVASAAAGVASIATMATNAYASYEQLAGGVEKLFGSAADTVIANAEQAYKTAGLSANDYMETVTSFSASLIGSLGGDTEEAARIADMAVQDMSDNANTFGTNIQDIQNAYQGFAKENYTMLDNLKLGYGGTKTEMERLIADANAVKEANGEMGDLSIESFADVTEAIHIMQEEMNIAGTTANEAAITIEGSVNSMKAAWENWLTALGDENADIGEKTNLLVESVTTALGNIIPRVEQILQSLGTAVSQYLPEIITMFVDFAKDIVETAAPIVMEFAMTLIEALPQLMVAGLMIIETLATAITENLPTIMETMTTVMTDIMEIIMDHIPDFLDSGLQIIIAMIEGLTEALPQLIEYIPTIITSVVTKLLEYLPQIIEAILTLFVTLLPALLAAFVEVFDQIIVAVGEWAGNMLAKAGEMGAGFIQKVVEFFTQLPGKIGEFIGNALSKVGEWAGNMLSKAGEMGQQFLAKVVEFFTQLPGKVAEFLANVISNVANWVTDMFGKAQEAGQQFLQGVTDTFQNVINFFVELPQNILNALGDLGSLLINAGSQIIDGLLSGLQGAIGGVWDFVSGIGSTIASLKGPEEYDRKLLIPNGGWIMDSLASGLEKGFPAVKDAIKDITEDIANNEFDIGLQANVSPVKTANAYGGFGFDRNFVFNVEINNTGQLQTEGRRMAEVLFTEYERMERTRL